MDVVMIAKAGLHMALTAWMIRELVIVAGTNYTSAVAIPLEQIECLVWLMFKNLDVVKVLDIVW